MRFALAIVFFISALFKLWSMEAFELALNAFFGVDIIQSAIISRLAIIAEITLSFFIALPFHHRKAVLVSILYSLIILCASVFKSNSLYYPFSLFSAGKIPFLIGKDVIMYALLAFCGIAIWIRSVTSMEHGYLSKTKRIVIQIVLLLTAIIAPIIYSAPDFLLFETRSIHEPRSFENDSLFKQLKFSNEQQIQASDEPYILIAVTPSCPFCQLLTSRIYFLQQHGHVTLPVYFTLLSSDDEDVALFWEMNHTAPFPFTRFDNMKDLISVVGGSFPALYLMRGRNYYCKMDFRDLNLSRLSEF